MPFKETTKKPILLKHVTMDDVFAFGCPKCGYGKDLSSNDNYKYDYHTYKYYEEYVEITEYGTPNIYKNVIRVKCEKCRYKWLVLALE